MPVCLGINTDDIYLDASLRVNTEAFLFDKMSIFRWQISDMKFGFRKPSLKKRIAARTSVKRFVRQSLGFKASRGMGWLTNPRKAAYNKVYNKTSRGCVMVVAELIILMIWIIVVS